MDISIGASNSHECPLITIGVTTYNRPELLKECINSILSQTYQNYEIIIGNDFVERLVSFESLSILPDDRIRIVNHPKNIGAYNNNYYLLATASGDWFTWLADDDLMHPKFLECAIRVAAKHDVNSVFTNYTAALSPSGIFPANISCKDPMILSGDEFLDKFTSRQIRAIGCYGLLNRKILPDIASAPRFGIGRPVYVDTFIPIIAASHGELAYIDEPLVFLRTHQASGSASDSCLETYSSAQADFLFEFERIRKSATLPSNYEWQIEGLLHWFALDGWAVIWRKHLGIFRRLVNFVSYSYSTLLPHLHGYRKVKFSLFLLRVSALDSARALASRLLKRRR